MKIILVRHGEAIPSETDPVLSEKGLKQAKNVADFLKQLKINQVYSGTLARTLQTSESLMKHKPELKKVDTSDLNEIYRVIVGGPERKGTSQDREKNDKARADKIFDEIISNKGTLTVVFTSGNVIRYFISKVLKVNPNEWWENLLILPGSFTLMEKNEKGLKVTGINEYHHQKEFLNDLYQENIKTTYLE